MRGSPPYGRTVDNVSRWVLSLTKEVGIRITQIKHEKSKFKLVGVAGNVERIDLRNMKLFLANTVAYSQPRCTHSISFCSQYSVSWRLTHSSSLRGWPGPSERSACAAAWPQYKLLGQTEIQAEWLPDAPRWNPLAVNWNTLILFIQH